MNFVKKYGSLLIFIALVAAASLTGSSFRPGEWYVSLQKPWWTPPGWAFPIAWTILYAMIAIAGWLVWRAQGWGQPIRLWGIQLILNALWSYAMFGLQRIDYALVDVSMLWLAIGAFVYTAWNVSRPAAYLFLPYWLWVTFAAALNFEVWRLNM